MPKLTLSIQAQNQFAGLPARSTLARWIAAAVERDSQLTLRFVGTKEGRRLNRDYRGRDYATDVLTFAYSTQPEVRADIVICVPVVKREAGVLRKSVYDHLAHLVVHATLHAHGHHHGNATAARAVAAREAKVLRSLGKRAPY
ncbi:MAG TPA: rRNA maturation RNase YbeY [Burkholderiaceae bacterium]|nr:rRNA maturation RNase YbeY [Burkholderiaceae bacterium]